MLRRCSLLAKKLNKTLWRNILCNFCIFSLFFSFFYIVCQICTWETLEIGTGDSEKTFTRLVVWKFHLQKLSNVSTVCALASLDAMKRFSQDNPGHQLISWKFYASKHFNFMYLLNISSIDTPEKNISVCVFIFLCVYFFFIVCILSKLIIHSMLLLSFTCLII
jgi:hypothetical protein